MKDVEVGVSKAKIKPQVGECLGTGDAEKGRPQKK